jgi:hypothetical protein
MENAQQRVELMVNVRRVGGDQFEAECAGLWGQGKTTAAALSACVAALSRKNELQGFYWRDAETGVSGMIAKPRKKVSAARNRDKGAVFDPLGGKMNGLQRMKDA